MLPTEQRRRRGRGGRGGHRGGYKNYNNNGYGNKEFEPTCFICSGKHHKRDCPQTQDHILNEYRIKMSKSMAVNEWLQNKVKEINEFRRKTNYYQKQKNDTNHLKMRQFFDQRVIFILNIQYSF